MVQQTVVAPTVNAVTQQTYQVAQRQGLADVMHGPMATATTTAADSHTKQHVQYQVVTAVQ